MNNLLSYFELVDARIGDITWILFLSSDFLKIEIKTLSKTKWAHFLSARHSPISKTIEISRSLLGKSPPDFEYPKMICCNCGHFNI